MENRTGPQPPLPPEPSGALAPQQPSNSQVPTSSGLRISTGILGIILGSWNLLLLVVMMFQISGYTPVLNGFLTRFHLIGAGGALAVGVMIIFKHRGGTHVVPRMLLGFAVLLTIMDGFMAWRSMLPGAALFTLIGGITAVLAIIVLAREGSAAEQR